MLYRIIILVFAGCLLITSCREVKVEEREAEAALDASIELPDTLNFWEHAAPIFFENCSPCHNPKGAAPFSFSGYTDFIKRIKTVRLAIADGYMPPWPADPDYRSFKDEKSLSELEKKTLLAWIDGGALEGSKPAKPPAYDASEEIGPEPDYIIKLPDTVFIPGDNKDRFNLAKFSFELPQDTIVRMIKFVPGNRQLVHHVNGHLINYAPEKKESPFKGEWMLNAETVSSLSAYQRMELNNDDGTYPPLLVSAFNYLPGVEPAAYPDGLGNVYLRKKGSFLLNTLHYGPSAKDTFDLSEIHLFFAAKRPKRPLREIQMGTLGETKVVPEFIVYADSVQHFTTRYEVKEDISVLTINPHMHLLGKTFTAYAVSPSKADTIKLIHIPRWDFRWQYFYTFEHMLKIPKGYTITAEAVFDNTINNPFNPFLPPKTVYKSGVHMKTTDEMFQFFITYVPHQEGDEKIKL